MHKNKLTYRQDIDGLRAIAVIAVIGYHAFPQWFPGGFVGVDIFFVISGFLITSIILKSSIDGNFTVLDFYSRRIRRIFPALITVLIACLLLGWQLLFPDELQQLGKHTLGAGFFVSNFIFWSEAGYFDIASELKPLLHLWSLSIEEQFYTLWPLTLLLFLKSKRVALCTTILAIASFALCTFGGLNKVANFYMPLTRIWELLCGALLVFIYTPDNILLRLPIKNGVRAASAEIFSLAGIVLLAFSIFFLLNNHSIFPGWASLLPTAGAALIIAAGPNTYINRYILGNRIAVFIGLISYSLYLWHWPFLAFPKIANGLVLSATTKILALTGATVFAIITYYVIERPLRRQGIAVSLLLIFIMLIIAGFGYLCSKGTISPKHAGDLFQKIAASKKDIPLNPIFSKAYNVDIDKRTYTGAGSGSKTTLFIGDSNMDQYWPGVEATLAANHDDRKALLGGCHIPVPHVVLPGETLDCNDLNSHAYSIANSHPDIDTIVLAARWVGASDFSYVDGKHIYPLHTPIGMKKAMQQLETHIRQLTTQGKTVYIILNIPEGVEFEPHNLIQRSLQGFKMVPRLEGGISLETHRNRTQMISTLLKEVANHSGAIILDPADFLCKNNWCSAVTDEGDPIYRDSDHLRGTYGYYHPQFIGQTLQPVVQ